jgi:hypothetical protein
MEVAEIVVKIPEELKQEMGEFPGIEWQAITRKLLKEELKQMRELKAIVSKSGLTERDVEELSAKIDKSLARRFRKSLK